MGAIACRADFIREPGRSCAWFFGPGPRRMRRTSAMHRSSRRASSSCPVFPGARQACRRCRQEPIPPTKRRSISAVRCCASSMRTASAACLRARLWRPTSLSPSEPVRSAKSTPLRSTTRCRRTSMPRRPRPMGFPLSFPAQATGGCWIASAAVRRTLASCRGCSHRIPALARARSGKSAARPARSRCSPTSPATAPETRALGSAGLPSIRRCAGSTSPTAAPARSTVSICKATTPAASIMARRRCRGSGCRPFRTIRAIASISAIRRSTAVIRRPGATRRRRGACSASPCIADAFTTRSPRAPPSGRFRSSPTACSGTIRGWRSRSSSVPFRWRRSQRSCSTMPATCCSPSAGCRPARSISARWPGRIPAGCCGSRRSIPEATARLITGRRSANTRSGLRGDHRNGDGGIALGFGYNRNGIADPGACGGTLWVTGSKLRMVRDTVRGLARDPALAQRLAAGGALAIDGLQGSPVGELRPQNTPPWSSPFIGFDEADGSRRHAWANVWPSSWSSSWPYGRRGRLAHVPGAAVAATGGAPVEGALLSGRLLREPQSMHASAMRAGRALSRRTLRETRVPSRRARARRELLSGGQQLEFAHAHLQQEAAGSAGLGDQEGSGTMLAAPGAVHVPHRSDQRQRRALHRSDFCRRHDQRGSDPKHHGSGGLDLRAGHGRNLGLHRPRYDACAAPVGRVQRGRGHSGIGAALVRLRRGQGRCRQGCERRQRQILREGRERHANGAGRA